MVGVCLEPHQVVTVTANIGESGRLTRTRSTAVPVKSLYDYLEAGDSLDEFLESFPSVTREQAVAALELARTMTEAHATAAR